MTSAEIAARQQILAALEAEFQEWKGSTNAAITRLNAATAGGDTGLFAVANAAIIVVGALNPYHQILLKAIADAAALVPAVLKVYVPPKLNLPELIDVRVGVAKDLSPYVVSSKPVVWVLAEPNPSITLSADGKLTGVTPGVSDIKVAVEDGVTL